MKICIIAALAAVLLLIWVISTRRELAVLDENADRAMGQVAVQLSSRFDALMALLGLARDYAADESQALIEVVAAHRSVITAKSLPAEVLRQEETIREVLRRVSMVAEQNPALKANPGYVKCMKTVDTCENMTRTSRLLYNDGVARLNRAVRTFPTRLIAGALGFHQRDYLEAMTADS